MFLGDFVGEGVGALRCSLCLDLWNHGACLFSDEGALIRRPGLGARPGWGRGREALLVLPWPRRLNPTSFGTLSLTHLLWGGGSYWVRRCVCNKFMYLLTY